MNRDIGEPEGLVELAVGEQAAVVVPRIGLAASAQLVDDRLSEAPMWALRNVTEETTMDPIGIVLWLVIGAIAGWLAGNIMKGGGFGLIGNIIVGIVGALIGGFVFGLLGITAGGLIGSLITAVVGACVLLFIVGLVKRA